MSDTSTQTPASNPSMGSFDEEGNYTPREIVWEVETDRARLLVASEVYYPAGWTALVGVDEAPILRTDFLLRGVPVPAGEHIVTMRFEPESREPALSVAFRSTREACSPGTSPKDDWASRRSPVTALSGSPSRNRTRGSPGAP